MLEVLKVAHFLAITSVLDSARSFLTKHLSPSNALHMAAVADRAGLPDARAAALSYVIQHFDELAHSPVCTGLTRIDRASLEELLRSDALQVEGELPVFRTLMLWLDAHEESYDGQPVSDEEAEEAGGDDKQRHSSLHSPGSAGAAAATAPAGEDGCCVQSSEDEEEGEGGIARFRRKRAATSCVSPFSPGRRLPPPFRGPTRPCPLELLQLIRLQHIPLEHLFREVSIHPRCQSAQAKQLIIDTFAFHTLHINPSPMPPVGPPQKLGDAQDAEAAAADEAPPPAAAAAMDALDAPRSPAPSAPFNWASVGIPRGEGRSTPLPQPPRRYSVVDARTVRLMQELRVRDGEERVKLLCETLPADAPIKFVARMRATIGQKGVLLAKSRRGSLKLRFADNLGLPPDRREFWFPPQALSFP